MLGSLGTFLEQLNPILGWLSDHQQLISDFISNGATGIAATTTSFSGDGVGHYLRQFSAVGSETLSFAANRDSNNRGNTYPGPVWLANAAELRRRATSPSWDCKNTGAGGDGSVVGQRRARRRAGVAGGVLGGADAARARSRVRSRTCWRRLTRTSSAARLASRRSRGVVRRRRRVAAEARRSLAERARRAARRRAAHRRSARARCGRARVRTP